MFNIKLLLTMLLVACFFHCTPQKNKRAPKTAKTYTMEMFDYTRFEEKKKDGHYDFALPDGTQVHEWETVPEYYVEQTEKPNLPLTTYKEFYYKEKSLKITGKNFYGFPIGVWKEYKENTSLLKEWNEDEAFHFSIDDLAKKMKEMGVDIMKKQVLLNVSRSESPSPAYTVSYPVLPGRTDEITIVIVDGVNGKLLNKSNKILTKQ